MLAQEPEYGRPVRRDVLQGPAELGGSPLRLPLLSPRGLALLRSLVPRRGPLGPIYPCHPGRPPAKPEPSTIGTPIAADSRQCVRRDLVLLGAGRLFFVRNGGRADGWGGFGLLY